LLTCRWTAAERTLFEEATQSGACNPGDWRAIATYIGTRDGSQVRKFADKKKRKADAGQGQAPNTNVSDQYQEGCKRSRAESLINQKMCEDCSASRASYGMPQKDGGGIMRHTKAVAASRWCGMCSRAHPGSVCLAGRSLCEDCFKPASVGVAGGHKRLCGRCCKKHPEANSLPSELPTSQYRGVSWITTDRVWRARIKHDNKELYIGNFDEECEAAAAYDRKAVELRGDAAKLNFPGPAPPEHLNTAVADHQHASLSLLSWSDKEVQQLKSLVKRDGARFKDWSTKAELLGTGRSEVSVK